MKQPSIRGYFYALCCGKHTPQVNRAYDANQKTVQTEDALIGKLWNEVVKV